MRQTKQPQDGFFRLPEGWCPITGMRMIERVAYTQAEKRKKREAYHTRKEAVNNRLLKAS